MQEKQTNNTSFQDTNSNSAQSGMTRRAALAGLTATMLAVTMTAATPAQARPSDAAYRKCAKACSDCHEACLTCYRHCQGMVKAGMKQHVVSEQFSADCADLCAVSAKLCARKGPMAVAACEATLKAAQACARECRKYPEMAVMTACTRSCDACAAACQGMIAA